MSLKVVILAAGKGTRMRSHLPKVLHAIGGQSMLSHTIQTAQELGAEETIVIYGHGGEHVKAVTQYDGLQWVEQKEQLGTGHAVQQAIPYLDKDPNSQVLILYGDVPLVQASTLKSLLAALNNDASLAVLTTILEDPYGLWTHRTC